jgi:triosephosphate isomerase
MIVLNLKTYPETIEKALFFADITKEVVEETGVRIVLCPPLSFLHGAAERVETFAQHTDPQKPGAHTGSVPAELLKYLGAKGSVINHSEKKLPLETVKATVERLHMVGLESLVCAASIKEAEEIAHFTPTFIAVEPPELIGSGVSVSKAKPEIVVKSVAAVKELNSKITVLCGAGVSNKEDIVKAMDLGSEGVLLASAFVKAKDPKAFLKDLAGAL